MFFDCLKIYTYSLFDVNVYECNSIQKNKITNIKSIKNNSTNSSTHLSAAKTRKTMTPTSFRDWPSARRQTGWVGSAPPPSQNGLNFSPITSHHRQHQHPSTSKETSITGGFISYPLRTESRRRTARLTGAPGW